MSVLIRGMKMPKECGECRWFYFEGMTCTTPRYYLDSRCELMESGQDWYGKDERGGWVGKDISNLPGYGGYYPHKHCVEAGTRADKCPLVEVQEPHGRLAEWLKILKSAKFEYNEAWRPITHPTPDVTYADKQRAQVILDKFRNSLGAMK